LLKQFCPEAKEHGISPVKTPDFESITGKGVRGIVNGRNVLFEIVAVLGGIPYSASPIVVEGRRAPVCWADVMFVAVGRQSGGAGGRRRPHEGEHSEAVVLLHKEGIRIIMLTGDSRTTAAPQ